MGGQVKARLTGRYRVYCGSGWEHTVAIDEQHVFDPEYASDELDKHLAAAWKAGDQDAAHDAADALIEWTLEGWADPCLDGVEEEDWDDEPGR